MGCSAMFRVSESMVGLGNIRSTLRNAIRNSQSSIRNSRKLVTTAGLAPAITWSQARHVASTLRGVAPTFWHAGGLFLGKRPLTPWSHVRGRLALPMGLAPTSFPQTTGRSAIELRKQFEIGSGSGNHTHLNEF